MQDHSKLEQALEYRFRDPGLLLQALTHRSHGSRHNERLEFLGDSVLNFVVASLLYERFPSLNEGDLSRVRASLVKQASLADIAHRLELPVHLRLGEGELKSGGFRRPSILADALEAVFGAVFLDSGFDSARQVIAHQYADILAHVDPATLGKDPKTLLQELVQGRRLDLPVYTVVATHGAAHNQSFDVECAIPALEIRVGASGASRRSAEQLAATLAIQALTELGGTPVSVRRRARRSPHSGASNGRHEEK